MWTPRFGSLIQTLTPRRSQTSDRQIKLFGAGKLNRLILATLRKADGPLRTLEVVDSICADLSYGPDAAKGMKNRVRANLLYLAKMRGLIAKEGERAEARWSLDSDFD